MIYAEGFGDFIAKSRIAGAGLASAPRAEGGPEVEIPIVEVDSARALNRVIAEWREEQQGRTFFRGQYRFYDVLPLSGAYRKSRSIVGPAPQALSKFLLEDNHSGKSTWGYLDSISQSEDPVRAFNNGRQVVPYYALEGLFQQYVGGTRWLDVVDNLHIALWMATRIYSEVEILPNAPTLPPRIKVSAIGGERVTLNDVYVYLYLFSLRDPSVRFPGLYEADESVHLLDLRECLPARFLRPHSQHAMLLRYEPAKQSTTAATFVVKIPANVALSMVGQSTLLETSVIFPESSEDIGFRSLFNHLSNHHGEGAGGDYVLDKEHFPCEYYERRKR